MGNRRVQDMKQNQVEETIRHLKSTLAKFEGLLLVKEKPSCHPLIVGDCLMPATLCPSGGKQHKELRAHIKGNARHF